MPGIDCRAEYRTCCGKHDVKVNETVLALLPESTAPVGALREIDLADGALGGRKGLKPLLEVLKHLPAIEKLHLRRQGLNSEDVQVVVDVLKTHPAVTAVDLSYNECPLAGPVVLDLTKKNQRLVSVNLAGCEVRPVFLRLIDLQLNKNKDLANGGTGAVSGDVKTAAERAVAQAQDELGPFCSTGAFGAGDADAQGSSFGAFNAGHTSAQKPSLYRPGSSLRRDKRRPTVCSEVWTDCEIDNFHAPSIPKPDDVVKWLCERLEHVQLFNHLDDRELKMAVFALEEKKYSMGDIVVQQGDEGGDTYYIIYSGECDSIVDESVQPLRKGDHFGEVQLFYHQDETATIKVTSSKLVAYTIEREIYRRILAKASKVKRAMYEGFLQNVNFLKGMTHPELLQLADALKAVKVKPGEHMIRYGEEGQWFYIILEGAVEVIGRDADGNNIKVCEFTVGECVGELEFINNHKCVADVISCTGEVRAAKMNRRHFEMCMGPVLDVLKRTANTSNVYQYYRQTLEKEERKASTDAAGPPTGRQGEHPWTRASGDVNEHEDPFAFGQIDRTADEEDNGVSADDDESDAFGGFCENTADDAVQMQEVNDAGVPASRGRRQTVSAEVLTEEDVESFQPNVVTKSEKMKMFISAALERMPLFCHLESCELMTLALAMEEMKFAKDEVILEAGADGDMFYLVANGEVHGIAPDEEPIEFRVGQHFGEVVLMYAQPYPMTFRGASHDIVCYTLDRNTYKHIMQKASMKKRAMYGDFLKKVRFLKTCSDGELLQLADALKPSFYASGDHLIHYGDDGTWFFIIVEGTVEVWGRDSEMKKTKVCEFQEGDCVGELEFINNHKCVADVVAKGNVRTAKMHRHHFEMCLGPIVDILRRQADTNEEYEYYRQTLAGNNAPVTSTD